jgi:hypothetical protein
MMPTNTIGFVLHLELFPVLMSASVDEHWQSIPCFRLALSPIVDEILPNPEALNEANR